MAVAAGTLLYRIGESSVEVLLVHPSGNYNRQKPWSIPKGLPDEGESLEEAARRETREEAGIEPPERLTNLGQIRYAKSGKTVHCFAGMAPSDAAPRCASWEVDRAEFVAIDDARRLLHPDQRQFLERLEALLNGEPRDA